MQIFQFFFIILGTALITLGCVLLVKPSLIADLEGFGVKINAPVGLVVLALGILMLVFPFTAHFRQHTGTASSSQSKTSPPKVPNTPPASTATAALVNPGTGKCLSGSAGSDGTPLILWACNGDVNQKWDIASDGTIRTKGLCMDAAWGGTTASTVVQIANCSGNPAQQFSLSGDTIYSTQASMCVGEVNGGTGIRLFPCDGGGSEVFRRG